MLIRFVRSEFTGSGWSQSCITILECIHRLGVLYRNSEVRGTGVLAGICSSTLDKEENTFWPNFRRQHSHCLLHTSSLPLAVLSLATFVVAGYTSSPTFFLRRLRFSNLCGCWPLSLGELANMLARFLVWFYSTTRSWYRTIAVPLRPSFEKVFFALVAA